MTTKQPYGVEDFSGTLICINLLDLKHDLSEYRQVLRNSSDGVRWCPAPQAPLEYHIMSPPTDLAGFDDFEDVRFLVDTTPAFTLVIGIARIKTESLRILLSQKEPSLLDPYVDSMLALATRLQLTGEDAAIFSNADYHEYPRRPLLLFLEPNNGETLSIPPAKAVLGLLAPLIEKFSNRYAWGVINFCSISSLFYALYPWSGTIITSPYKVQIVGDNSICLPYLVKYMAYQIACYWWLHYEINLLLGGDLAKCHIPNLRDLGTARSAMEYHHQMLQHIAPLSDHRIRLATALPYLSSHIDSLRDLIQQSDYAQPDAPYAWVYEERSLMDFIDKPARSAYSNLEDLLDRLIKKADLILSLSSEMSTYSSTRESISLQRRIEVLTWVLIILTSVMTMLTGILALHDFSRNCLYSGWGVW